MKQQKMEVKLQSESAGCLLERAARENKQILRRSLTVCLSIKQNGMRNNPTHSHTHTLFFPSNTHTSTSSSTGDAQMTIQDRTVCSSGWNTRRWSITAPIKNPRPFTSTPLKVWSKNHELLWEDWRMRQRFEKKKMWMQHRVEVI